MPTHHQLVAYQCYDWRALAQDDICTCSCLSEASPLWTDTRWGAMISRNIRINSETISDSRSARGCIMLYVVRSSWKVPLDPMVRQWWRWQPSWWPKAKRLWLWMRPRPTRPVASKKNSHKLGCQCSAGLYFPWCLNSCSVALHIFELAEDCFGLRLAEALPLAAAMHWKRCDKMQLEQKVVKYQQNITKQSTKILKTSTDCLTIRRWIIRRWSHVWSPVLLRPGVSVRRCTSRWHPWSPSKDR